MHYFYGIIAFGVQAMIIQFAFGYELVSLQLLKLVVK